MSKTIAIIAVLIGLASAGYAMHLHYQPSLPYFKPHRTFEHEGKQCAAWKVNQFVVVLCDGKIGVLYPKKEQG